MKQRLIENISVSIPKENIQIFEVGKEQLIESSGNSFSCRGIIKQIPITRFTENKNGRVYPQSLWKKVVEQKVIEGAVCNADHAEDGRESVKDICGVWKNSKLGEHHAYADLYCIGENGSLMLELVKIGGRAGFSTCGYGEFLKEQDNVVDPDSFELSSIDWVQNPSQEVYATQENLEQNKQPIESAEKENLQEPSFTNKKQENIQSIQEKIEDSNIIEKKNNEVKKNMKFEESMLRNNLNEAIRKAKTNSNIREAIEMLKEADVPVELADVKVKIDGTIAELQVKLDEQKINAETKLAETVTKFEEATKALTETTVKYEKAKAIIEKVGLDENVNVSELKENVKKMNEELENYKLNEKEMLKDIQAMDKVFGHNYAKKLEITKLSEITQLMEDTFKRNKDINYLSEQLKKFKESLKIAEKHIVLCEKELTKRGYKFKEENEMLTPEEDQDKIVTEEDENELPENPEDEEIVEGFEGGEGDENSEEEEYEFSFDEEDEEEMKKDDSEIVAEEDEDIMGVDKEEPEIAEEEDMGGQVVTDDGQIIEEEGDDEIPFDSEEEEIVEETEEEPIDLSAESNAGENSGEYVIDEEVEEEPIDLSAESKSGETGGETSLDSNKKSESFRPYRFTFNHQEERVIRNSDMPIKRKVVKQVSKPALQEKKLVEAFVIRETKRNPVARDIKKHLLASSTLKEAMTKLIKFENQKKGKKDGLKIKRMSESFVDDGPSWLKGRK